MNKQNYGLHDYWYDYSYTKEKIEENKSKPWCIIETQKRIVYGNPGCIYDDTVVERFKTEAEAIEKLNDFWLKMSSDKMNYSVEHQPYKIPTAGM